MDVYEDIEKCPPNRAGPPECDIPYETCKDEKRRCFNNSKCLLKKNALTDDYSYTCDCQYAATKSNSKFAGYECEHSQTVLCEQAKEGYGSQFCANAGLCMSFSYKAETHWGCACPSDFVGAHCQYLAVDITGPLEGEAIFPDVQANFWGFIPEKRDNSKGTSVAIGVSVSAIVMISLAFAYALLKRKEAIRRNADRPSVIDPNNIEADGSGTMGVDNEML
jgi:hypothetical protein